MKRRDFIFLSLILGLAGALPRRALAQVVADLKFDTQEFRGPLLDRILTLLDYAYCSRITQEQLVTQLNALYGEFDLNREFADLLPRILSGDNKHRMLVEAKSSGQKFNMNLFYINPRKSVPPHGHHELTSTQTILKGRIHVRQYDRVRRIDPTHVLIRPVTDRVFEANSSILMTESKSNVHWFGGLDESALLFNLQAYHLPGSRFDGDRLATREYLDPTVYPIDQEGLILAEQAEEDASYEKFHYRPLSDFEV